MTTGLACNATVIVIRDSAFGVVRDVLYSTFCEIAVTCMEVVSCARSAELLMMFQLMDRVSGGVEPMINNLESYIVNTGLDDMKSAADIITTVGRLVSGGLNPFTSKSDQFQISPAASPDILHHTVWRTWLFIAYSDDRWLYYTSSHYLTYTFLLKRLGDCSFGALD